MKNKQNGKGSRRRPTDEAKVRANWDSIFGKKDKKPIELQPFESDPISHAKNDILKIF